MGLCVSINYPVKIMFVVGSRKLPRFKYGCKTRGKILIKILHSLENEGIILSHSVDSYIVEDVRSTSYGEQWDIG